MSENDVFSKLSSDVFNKIILVLDDLKDWGRLACVSKRFCREVHEVCYKMKCIETNPTLVSDLISDADSTSPPGGWGGLFNFLFCCPGLVQVGVCVEDTDDANRVLGSHLASGNLELSGELGNKLLDDRFGENRFYISKWSAGCVHIEGHCQYLLFKGIFVNFKKTTVWRALSTVDDGKEYKVDLKCPFCSSEHTYDLHTPFCFEKPMKFRDICGSPLGRSFVCKNGHVFGAWDNLRFPMPRKFCCRTTWVPYYRPQWSHIPPACT